MKTKRLSQTLLASAMLLYATVGFAVPVDYLALYTFNDGTAADSSANNNDGTVIGGVSFVTDSVRGAVAQFAVSSGLSGIDTGIDINPLARPAVTFGGWFLHSNYGFVSKTMSHDDGGYDRTLGLDTRGGTGNEVSAFTGSGVLGSGFVPASDSWYHAAVSYDGTSVSLFVNGALAASATDSTGSSSFNLFLGANPGFEEDLIGRMDDAFVFGRTLTASEIAAIYSDGFTSGSIPLPATLPLVVIGLAGLIAARRRL
jgi:hypothetical protein